MGLIHWWPLNGDMKDYGLNPKNGSIVGSATVTEPGLTKYCLSGMSGDQTTAGVNVSNCNLLDEISNEYSAALWFKLHGTHVHYEGAFISSGNWNNQRWTFGIAQANNRIQPLTNASNQNFISLGKTLTNERWYHVVTVYKNGRAYLYLDGKLVSSVAATAPYQSSATNLCIGRETYASGYFSFNGDICDVRIYDNALSQYDVEELYRSKIVHYDFNHKDDITIKNLLYGKSLSASRLTGATMSSSYSNGKLTITTGANSDGKSNSARLYLPDSLLISGTAYFISFKWKLLSGSGTINPSDFCDASLTYKTNVNKGSYYQFASRGYRSAGYNSTYRFVDFTGFSPNSSYELWDFQLEEDIEGKTQASNYINTTETGGSLTDCSGYHNNKKSGSIYYSADTNIGSYSLASPIVCENKSVGVSSFTYNFWIRNKNTSAANITLFSDGKITCGTTSATDYLSTTLTLSNSTTISATSTTQKMSLLSSKFHMVTVTFDSASLKLYVDGSLHATATTTLSALNSESDLNLLPNTKNVLISDFKAYASALTEDQILDIYRESGAVDNRGTLHAEEIIEVGESELDDHSPEVLNYNRQSKAESFEEGNDLFEVYKQSTDLENLVYLEETTTIGSLSNVFSYNSSQGNNVIFKSNDNLCTITFDKETQIFTINTTDYFSGATNFLLLKKAPANKPSSIFIDYLDGTLAFNTEATGEHDIQIGGLTDANGWSAYSKITQTTPTDLSNYKTATSPTSYLRLNFHNVQANKLRLRICYSNVENISSITSNKPLDFFMPAVIDKETYISDYAIIKPTEIIEK